MTDAVSRTAQWVIDWRAARAAECRARLEREAVQRVLELIRQQSNDLREPTRPAAAPPRPRSFIRRAYGFDD